jgi:hypothetical protein
MRSLWTAAFVCIATVTPAFATISFIGSQAGLGADDSTNWAQLGGDQTVLAGGFSATSGLGIGVTGSFSVSNGLVAVVCPASPTCSWTTSGTGMSGGDSAIWAFDNGTGLGTGPISLTFSKALIGGGAWLQADTSGAYTASIQAFNGSTSLGTFTLSSDASGDPVFLGVLQGSPATANITKLVFALTACASGCTNLGDFAIDTLIMTDPASTVPEPSSLLLLGGGLAGMVWVFRKRSSRNGIKS